MRKGQRKLYGAEQDRVQSLGGNVAGKRIILRDIKQDAANKVANAGSGSSSNVNISDTLRKTGRSLAQSDRRYFRAAEDTKKLAGEEYYYEDDYATLDEKKHGCDCKKRKKRKTTIVTPMGIGIRGGYGHHHDHDQSDNDDNDDQPVDVTEMNDYEVAYMIAEKAYTVLESFNAESNRNYWQFS